MWPWETKQAPTKTVANIENDCEDCHKKPSLVWLDGVHLICWDCYCARMAKQREQIDATARGATPKELGGSN